eukprot:TRINITY_DN3904_c0_g1_i1.p1 TRINITY_DN3904_c0_g1~~TRINITY_DN3904_c0_g1_i1.p1  ORF type:complete len:635 (-),score=154.28 TRINITY_DN3904_c0_g1_i1:434-2338(-)
MSLSTLRLSRVVSQLRSAKKSFATTSNVKRLVVVGGVAGGASAAARGRRLSESAQIIVLEKGASVSFANCGLPYYIGGTIKARSALELHTPTSLGRLLNIDVRTHTLVEEINRQKSVVRVRDLKNNKISEIAYDRLVLAPGASPIRPPLPGLSSPRVVTLRTLQDMDTIKDMLSTTTNAVVVGGGFIGLEMAEQLVKIGKNVTVVELQPHVLPPADDDIAIEITKEMKEKGIKIITGDALVGVEEETKTNVLVKLKSGHSIKAQLVVLSIGVRADTIIARNAKLKLNATGHIVVNEYQQTSDPNIYAVGDAVETKDGVWPEKYPDFRTVVALGGPANRQGRLAATHIFRPELAQAYPGSIATAIVRVFSTVVAMTGWSTTQLKRKQISFRSTIVQENDHAGYYPGSTPLKLKIMWDPKSGRLLGAQCVGTKGIDKRIDVLATAIRSRMTIDDLSHLELCYAPPFNSAKDPINIAGFVACNERDSLVSPIMELSETNKNNNKGEEETQKPILLDVRGPALVKQAPLRLPEKEKEYVEDVINIPIDQLRSRLSELDPSAPIITFCMKGKTSYFAARILSQSGFTKVRSLSGGMGLRPQFTLPQQTQESPSPSCSSTPSTSSSSTSSGSRPTPNCCA